MTEHGINPAALGALLKGDIANAIIASTPGGIEAQEAQGQRDLVNSSTLPIEFGWQYTREQAEAIGIVYGNPVDDLFVNVQLPEGWVKRPTEHSMWSNLLDDQGRVRASIFYKAAFYDRKAHIDLECRLKYSVEPVCGWEKFYEDKEAGYRWHGIVYDCCGIVWEYPDSLDPRPSFDDRDAYGAWRKKRDNVENELRTWMSTHYPDHRDPLAYWDEDIPYKDIERLP